MTAVRDQLFPQKPPGSRFRFSRTGVQPSPGSSTIELPSVFAESESITTFTHPESTVCKYKCTVVCEPLYHLENAGEGEGEGVCVLVYSMVCGLKTEGLLRGVAWERERTQCRSNVVGIVLLAGRHRSSAGGAWIRYFAAVPCYRVSATFLSCASISLLIDFGHSTV